MKNQFCINKNIFYLILLILITIFSVFYIYNGKKLTKNPKASSVNFCVEYTGNNKAKCIVGNKCPYNRKILAQIDCDGNKKTPNVCCDYSSISTTIPTKTISPTRKTRKLTSTPRPTITYKCAPNFYVKTNSQICHLNGGVGNRRIQDIYSCVGDENYPNPETACMQGTELNNTYAYASGNTPSYSCYVPQDLNASTSPSGCPINRSFITCASGFVFDPQGSNLSWKGKGFGWGCYYRCKASPDPYISNPAWPCATTGYSPIGGGGGETCCAKY